MPTATLPRERRVERRVAVPPTDSGAPKPDEADLRSWKEITRSRIDAVKIRELEEAFQQKEWGRAIRLERWMLERMPQQEVRELRDAFFSLWIERKTEVADLVDFFDATEFGRRSGETAEQIELGKAEVRVPNLQKFQEGVDSLRSALALMSAIDGQRVPAALVGGGEELRQRFRRMDQGYAFLKRIVDHPDMRQRFEAFRKDRRASTERDVPFDQLLDALDTEYKGTVERVRTLRARGGVVSNDEAEALASVHRRHLHLFQWKEEHLRRLVGDAKDGGEARRGLRQIEKRKRGAHQGYKHNRRVIERMVEGRGTQYNYGEVKAQLFERVKGLLRQRQDQRPPWELIEARLAQAFENAEARASAASREDALETCKSLLGRYVNPQQMNLDFWFDRLKQAATIDVERRVETTRRRVEASDSTLRKKEKPKSTPTDEEVDGLIGTWKGEDKKEKAGEETSGESDYSMLDQVTIDGLLAVIAEEDALAQKRAQEEEQDPTKGLDQDDVDALVAAHVAGDKKS